MSVILDCRLPNFSVNHKKVYESTPALSTIWQCGGNHIILKPMKQSYSFQNLWYKCLTWCCCWHGRNWFIEDLITFLRYSYTLIIDLFLVSFVILHCMMCSLSASIFILIRSNIEMVSLFSTEDESHPLSSHLIVPWLPKGIRTGVVLFSSIWV